jgi:hypothetical protein
MKEIHVNSKKHGFQIIMVDDEDFDFANKWVWSVNKIGNTFYAVRGDKHNKFFYLHRQLLGLTDPTIFADHRDRNGLNNTRSNLRVATRSQNLANIRSKGGSSNYLGVSYMKRDGVWIAQIMKDRKYRWLGRHVTEEEAAMAYNKAAIEIHGEFANLNIINAPHLLSKTG